MCAQPIPSMLMDARAAHNRFLFCSPHTCVAWKASTQLPASASPNCQLNLATFRYPLTHIRIESSGLPGNQGVSPSKGIGMRLSASPNPNMRLQTSTPLGLLLRPSLARKQAQPKNTSGTLASFCHIPTAPQEMGNKTQLPPIPQPCMPCPSHAFWTGP